MRHELVVVARRGHIDIVADILRVAKAGVKKTQIIFRARINSEQSEKYLNFMIQKGLIVVNKQKNYTLYQTSDKGLEYLYEYHKLKEFLI